MLSALLVFPLMFFLASPQSVHFLELAEHSDSSDSQPEVSQQTQAQQYRPTDMANEREQQNELNQNLDSTLDSDLTDNSDSVDYLPETSALERHEQEEYDPDFQESFITNEPYTNTASTRSVKNNISTLSFTRSHYTQEQSGIAFEETAPVSVTSSNTSAVTTKNTVTENNIAGEDNSNLYLAKTEYVVERVKNKCPPVYGEINSYARNMRIVMGCDTE